MKCDKCEKSPTYIVLCEDGMDICWECSGYGPLLSAAFESVGLTLEQMMEEKTEQSKQETWRDREPLL